MSTEQLTPVQQALKDARERDTTGAAANTPTVTVTDTATLRESSKSGVVCRIIGTA